MGVFRSINLSILDFKSEVFRRFVPKFASINLSILDFKSYLSILILIV